MGFDRVTGPLQENEFHEFHHFPDITPKMQLGQLIATDDPEQFVIRIKRPEMSGGIDRVAHPSAPQLKVGNFEAFVPLNCFLQHRKPLGSGRLNVVRFQRRLCSRHENQSIQAVLLVRILRREQMTEMDRIEASTE